MMFVVSQVIHVLLFMYKEQSHNIEIILYTINTRE